MEKIKIKRAISIIEKSRKTHVDWAMWQESVSNWKVSIKPEDTGDPEHHRQCISEYDEVLNVLYSYYNEKNIENYNDDKSLIKTVVTDQGNREMFCRSCGEKLEDGEFLIYCPKCHVYFTGKKKVLPYSFSGSDF